MKTHLHIISPSVPWPPHDSRNIDIVEQLKLFHKEGIRVHLHYYCNDLNCHPTELNRYCESIHRYDCGEENRMDNSCDSNKKLLEAINQDDYPVLFESLHCTANLAILATSGRKIIVRMFDDECRNASHRAKEEMQLLKKFRLKKYSAKMKEYEDALPPNVLYVFSNRGNASMFMEDHQFNQTRFIPLLHPFNEIKAVTGSGNFFLYHGDLSDPYNEKAVVWLLEKVFNDVKINFVIAGKSPGKRIRKLGHLYAHTCLIADPSETEMEDLVRKAHSHVLPSFSYKSPELKLVRALHEGRHCIVNENAVKDTALAPACYVAETANAFKSLIWELHRKPFEEEEIRLRERLFSENEPSSSFIELLYQ